MLKKLELDALRADLASVNALLASRSEEADPVGWLQFNFRKQELEEELQRLELREEKASIGLFFGGNPVLGSRGVLAEFAGKAIKSFQDLVSKRFASMETGNLGLSGPIPMRNCAQLMITDVVRGSFGFVLEEAGEPSSHDSASIKQVMNEISQLITRIASEEDEEQFQQALETLDSRILITLKEFFQLLDNSSATLRLVEGMADFSLNREAIRRARKRTESMEITEREDEEIIGELYLLPASRRFEMLVMDESGSGRWIRGSIGAHCLEQLKTQYARVIKSDVIGNVWRTKMKVREVHERNRNPRLSYILMELIDKRNDN